MEIVLDWVYKSYNWRITRLIEEGQQEVLAFLTKLIISNSPSLVN